MITMKRIEVFLARFPLAAVAAYFALIVVFVFITMGTALDVLQRRDAVAAALEILDRIEVHDPGRAPTVRTDVDVEGARRRLRRVRNAGRPRHLHHPVARSSKTAQADRIEPTQMPLERLAKVTPGCVGAVVSTFTSAEIEATLPTLSVPVSVNR